MELHDLKPVDGARHSKKRIGRGTGSGHGKTSGRGSKGQNSRSGGGVRPGFEGGQTPLFKRLPKRGFTNMNRKDYAVVNVADLNCDCFEAGSKVTSEILVKAGLISKNAKNIKVLGNGKLEKNLIVCAHKFSKSAEKEIVEAGGKIEVI
ncbi:MAG: 50S ribosomal protein L15 [Bacilli bacterium]|nr:50S ribosomal protein L15 [Bacilli bacterium]